MNLTVEKLEDRLLLAGNVTTSFKNGTLTIKGDNSDNMISIDGDINSGFVITGFDTTVNGSAAPVEIAGVKNIKIDMRDGNDIVSLGDLGDFSLNGNLTVKMGNGDDEFYTGNSYQDYFINIDGKVSINMGNNDDIVGFDNTTFNNQVKVVLGSGDDDLLFTGADIFNHTKVQFNGGKGSDLFIPDVFDEGGTLFFAKNPSIKAFENLM